MADVLKNCDVYQGFNFRKDKNVRVGFLTSFVIGGVTDLEPDLAVKDPMDPEAELMVFSVLHTCHWGTAKTDPLHFDGQVSVDNKKAIDIALFKSMTQVDVTFGFKIYEYDPSAKKYYLAFHDNDAEMQGRIMKNGNELALSVGDTPNSNIQSPENVSFHVGLVPESAEQELHLAVSETDKFVKQWGLKDRS